MAERDEAALRDLLEDFRQAVEDCEDLYVSCAKEHARAKPEWTGNDRREFVQKMTNLGHGLILKVFVDIAYIQQDWSAQDLELAAELFQHIWYRKLTNKQLKEALAHFMGQNQRWDDLIAPFTRMAVFRNRIHQLRTVVIRLANVVAKADGTVTPEETRALKWIQAELARVLEPVPVPEDEEEELPPGRVATEKADKRPPEPCEPGLLPLDAPDPSMTEALLNEALAELEDLIGLAGIKQDVRSLINYLKMQKAREEFGLPPTPISLHSVFSGNPGTGKTSVARLLGKILGALRIIAKGHLVETDRSGLVASYVGQTGPKAHKKIDEALDGVLFIDEAYSLVAESGEDPYGAEALQVLLKRMEDDRHRLVVILAGYPEPMTRLLRTNPGLASRFNRTFHFPDYTAAELGRIFDRLRQNDHYELTTLARVKLLLGFQYLLENKNEQFGNGRMVRNVFEQAIGRLADRISGVAPLTRELLSTLQPEDIVMDGVPPAVWSDLENDSRSFRLICPGCKHESRLPQRFLSHKATCKRCQKTFSADWGEVDS